MLARLPMRCSVPARLSGTRTMRLCSASACRIAWRIHHTAYEMNLIPFVSSNLCAARIRPRLPSLIRSESETPWFWYFFATRDDEAQVGAHELVERLLIALADALGERDLLFPRDQRIDADVAQILIERALFERRLLLFGVVAMRRFRGVQRLRCRAASGGGEGRAVAAWRLRFSARARRAVSTGHGSATRNRRRSRARSCSTRPSGRPRSSESGTNPQYRLSSELSRLSPRTKYCASGTTNGPQLFRDGW